VISSGQLTLGGVGAISSQSRLQIDSGAAVNLTGLYAANNINRTFAGLTGAGVLDGAGGTVTINKTSGSDTFSGSVQGAQGLIKDGAGTLILAGTNTYTGATTVSAGTLLVTGALASTVSVSDGATLGDEGTVGALSFAGNSFFDIFTAISGNPMDSTTTISFSGTGFGIDNLVSQGSAVNWAGIADGTYTLITGTLNTANLGNVGLANAYDIDGPGGSRTAYFQNGSLQLVVVPEPRAALLGGLGMLMLLRRRRNCWQNAKN
jgi:autotransporter-associated beta strand protein